MKLNEIATGYLPKASTLDELLASIKDGKFTKDGSKLNARGNFDCGGKELISLNGVPNSVANNFNCGNNKLRSLNGAPLEVGGTFECHINRLTSLEGTPQEVKRLNCSVNLLTSLKGAPKIVNDELYCGDNKLTSLEGAPIAVGGYFDCGNNELTSLKGAPNIIRGSFRLTSNKLTSLHNINEYIKQIDKILFVEDNPIKSHIVGVLLINKLKQIEMDNKEVQTIINKYLPNTRGMKAVRECQAELTDAGFEEFAKL